VLTNRWISLDAETRSALRNAFAAVLSDSSEVVFRTAALVRFLYTM
jgi:hypothetical protein